MKGISNIQFGNYPVMDKDIIAIEDHDFDAWCNKCNAITKVERIYFSDELITDYITKRNYSLRCERCQSYNIGKSASKRKD